GTARTKATTSTKAPAGTKATTSTKAPRSARAGRKNVSRRRGRDDAFGDDPRQQGGHFIGQGVSQRHDAQIVDRAGSARVDPFDEGANVVHVARGRLYEEGVAAVVIRDADLVLCRGFAGEALVVPGVEQRGDPGGSGLLEREERPLVGRRAVELLDLLDDV